MPIQAIFLSYASQDADAARRICDALRATGLEVWFDQSELRGGDAWDQSIRKQIKECALFVPVISANTNAREEGYFRLEWKLAVDRSHLMADDKAYFFPVVLGDVAEPTARVPDKFRERQWTRLDAQESYASFADHLAKVLDGRGAQGNTGPNGAPDKEIGNQVLTPDSFAPATPTLPQATRLRRTTWMTAGLIVIVAAAIYGAMIFLRPSTDAIGSIAVLPFQIKSADADTDYLADGLAETLIYQLSRLPKLKVSPASSVYRYKGKETDPLKIGAELGVAAVMTGRLTQRGESLSISVELVDVRNKKSLWGEKYERKMADLLATQRDIASEISRKLQLNLSAESTQRLSKGFTDNSEAYQLYLKGQYLYARRGKENLERAVDLFHQALKLDANFAKAHVALAEAYSIAAFNRNQRPRHVLPLAAAAAERALAIDPRLAEAHSAKASIAAADWRWEEARQGFAKAIELNPDVAEIRFRYGVFYLMPMGRHDEAIAEINRAIIMEPQSTIYAAALTRALLRTGKAQLALENAKKAHSFDPDHVTAHAWLMLAHAVSGNYTEVLAQVAKWRSEPAERASAFLAGWAYVHVGKLSEAKQELQSLKETGRDIRSGYQAGILAWAIGNRDEAFALLEAAFVDKEVELAYLRDDPFAAPLRNDPRFASLVKRMGLPP